MIDFKCGDIVQVKALMVHGEINIKCKVIEYKNDNGFPKQPTFRAIETVGKIKKGQVFGGSVTEIEKVYD
jgi:hypothetical protein